MDDNCDTSFVLSQAAPCCPEIHHIRHRLNWALLADSLSLCICLSPLPLLAICWRVRACVSLSLFFCLSVYPSRSVLVSLPNNTFPLSVHLSLPCRLCWRLSLSAPLPPSLSFCTYLFLCPPPLLSLCSCLSALLSLPSVDVYM